MSRITPRGCQTLGGRRAAGEGATIGSDWQWLCGKGAGAAGVCASGRALPEQDRVGGEHQSVDGAAQLLRQHLRPEPQELETWNTPDLREKRARPPQ